jgi:tRNA threonylcarbamoyladenosine biosynthesis protein TsaE
MITSRILETKALAETMAVGQALASDLEPGDVLALYGDLGAGKTSLVKGIAAGLGITAEITSPTFTLVHEHDGGRFQLYHADLYRLGAVDDALDIGIEDCISDDGVTVLEWAEKIEAILPDRTIRIRLETIDERSRRITITAP